MLKICKIHQTSLATKLKAKGLKTTPARLEILDILEHNSAPLSIEGIGKNMKNKKADQATIYRNMESLKQVGILRQVSLNTNQAHYELVEKPHHHHLICEKCGIVKDVNNCASPNIPPVVLKKLDFTKINFHSLEFFGVCNKCLKK